MVVQYHVKMLSTTTEKSLYDLTASRSEGKEEEEREEGGRMPLRQIDTEAETIETQEEREEEREWTMDDQDDFFPFVSFLHSMGRIGSGI